MNGSTVANSPLLYILIAVGLASIVVYALISIKKAKACCLDQGISKEKIREVIISTISASIVPSLAILIGFLLLANSLGSAWPWCARSPKRQRARTRIRIRIAVR